MIKYFSQCLTSGGKTKLHKRILYWSWQHLIDHTILEHLICCYCVWHIPHLMSWLLISSSVQQLRYTSNKPANMKLDENTYLVIIHKCKHHFKTHNIIINIIYFLKDPLNFDRLDL